MDEKMCDCETAHCEKADNHQAGSCDQPAAIRVQTYGEWQNLCNRCASEREWLKETGQL